MRKEKVSLLPPPSTSSAGKGLQDWFAINYFSSRQLIVQPRSRAIWQIKCPYLPPRAEYNDRLRAERRTGRVTSPRSASSIKGQGFFDNLCTYSLL